jgi:hypothetical protein
MPALLVAPLLAQLAAPAHADPGHPPAADASVPVAWDLSREEPPAGSLRWVAVPTLRPCEAPMGACTAAPLKVGDAVVVTAVGDAGSPTSRPSRWLQVARATPPPGPDQPAAAGPPLGWVLAHQLSGASWSVDLDEDGEKERAVVRFDDKRGVELHVVEPGGTHATLALGQASDIDGPQTEGTVRLVTKATAGLPLVHVNWSAREMCGSGDYSRYASYRSPGPGQPGAARLALEHGGTGGDSPMWYETKATFDGRGGVLIHLRSGESADDGTEQVTTNQRTTRTLDRTTGVFQAPPEPPPPPPTP